MEQSTNKTTEVKVPKKRGRKPTGRIFQIEKGTVKNIETDNECIIAYLPLSLGDTKNITDIGDISEAILEKTAININKSNITIINDLKNIISHTSECSSDKDVDKREYLNQMNNPHNLSQSHKKDDDIIKLKSKIDELEKLLYDNIKFDKLNEICIDITKGNIENIHCWWCCSSFDHYPVGIPYNYRDDTFHTYGYFCSFNCAKAHNLDNVDNKTEEKNCLLMMLRKKLTNDDAYIKPANPRYSLKIFGGYQTIEEYRKDFKMIDKTSILIFPPLKPIKLYIEDEYKHKIVRFQNDYKVKRNKPLQRTANSLASMLKIKD
jgi:hypothetical protein